MSQPELTPPRTAESMLGYRLARLGRLIYKELSEILRDRRTILTLVLMPLLLYPLISIALQQFFVASGVSMQGQKGYRTGFVSAQERAVFFARIRAGESVVGVAKSKISAEPALLSPENSFALKDKQHLEAALRGGNIDIGIRIPGATRIEVTQQPGGPQLALSSDEALRCELYYKADSLRGIAAVTYIERRLAAANNLSLSRRLGLPDVMPKELLMWPEIAPVHTAEEGFLSLAALVPLVLILMTITGAVYPAIDLTAGERERGTLEMLIAAPVPRMSLLFAKYVAVVSVAVLTALINLTAMISTIFISGLSALVFDRGLSVLLVLELFGLLLLFAAFFSAVLLSLTSFARSFKEAQAYLIPLMLFSFAPGMMGMMPGLRLEGVNTVVPLLNIVLLSRDLLEGGDNPAAAAVIIASTIFYAMAAIAIAARFFGSEAVLYNTQNSWADLWRQPAQPQPEASVTTALMCLALMLPTWFALNGIIGQVQLPITDSLVLMALVSLLLFAGFPLAAAALRRVRLLSGFRLRWPAWSALVAAGLLGLCVWPWVLQLLSLLQSPIDTAMQQQYERLLEPLRRARAQYPALMAACLMIPAVAEEFFFRGFLFSALRAKCSARTTIISTAVLFGLFHVITTGAFAFERLLPSTLLGLLLGWICHHSGSVVPAMLMHTLHNGMLVVVGQGELAPGQEIPQHWLTIGAAGSVLGLGLLQIAGRRPSPS